MHSASDTVDKLLRRGRAPIAEGTCVVFSNHQLVHRILTMFNSSECDTANRDFVALFVVDQREPVGTTLQPEVLPSDEDRLVLDGSKYLDGDRSTTFADRDHRRRLRLFDQLTPKTTFNFDSTVNGQTAWVLCAAPLLAIPQTQLKTRTGIPPETARSLGLGGQMAPRMRHTTWMNFQT